MVERLEGPSPEAAPGVPPDGPEPDGVADRVTAAMADDDPVAGEDTASAPPADGRGRNVEPDGGADDVAYGQDDDWHQEHEYPRDPAEAEPAQSSGRLNRVLSMVGSVAGGVAGGAGGRLGEMIAAHRARKATRKAEAAREAEELDARAARAAAIASRHYDHPRAAALSRQTAGDSGQSRHVNIDMAAMRANGMLTLDAERSIIAEEFRLVKRPLLLRAFAEGEDRIEHGNLIMVSSGRPGEGKTFCAVNLAMSIALERDLTVMLIDADVAKPSVPSVLGFEAELGLIDLVADDTLDVSDVLVRTNIENLTVLPAGRPHHLATELLASERMEQLIVELAERYPDRVIIIDSSPVLMSSVPGVLALYVGQIVFVVQAEKSTQSSIDAALGLISACENIYLLLNKTRSIGGAEKFGAYYGYYR